MECVVYQAARFPDVWLGDLRTQRDKSCQKEEPPLPDSGNGGARQPVQNPRFGASA